MAITIKDVAKRAGVSPSTVSRALSGKVHVDRDTKHKVMEAVKDLNYAPNKLAKGLKEGKTSTIGLILPNIRNPVFPVVARGVEDTAREMGYTVILCNTDENLETEKEYVDKLKNKWVDGLIFATAGRAISHILDLKNAGFPVVLLVRNPDNQVDAVVIDNYESARQGVTYLIGKGHKRIAIINGDMDLTLYRERFDGYKRALEDAGIKMTSELIVEDYSKNSDGYLATKNLLNKGIIPDAIFASSDPKAAGAIRAIKDKGYRVPQDISVMGFDGLDISALLDPQLTTIAQPLYEMGTQAAKRVIEMSQGQNLNREPIIDIMETQLIIRSSVAEIGNKD